MTPSRQSRILAFCMYWFLRPLTVMFARPRFVPVLRRIIEAITFAHRKGTVVEPAPQGEWVRGPGVPKSVPRTGPFKSSGDRMSPGGDPPEAAILYLHGSGYVVCSPKTHRGLVSFLSSESGLPAYSVDYRLAPEHPFPAAFDDTVAAYRHLLDQGYSRIVVAGDSAGGHLAISLVAALTEADLPGPAGLVLFSPLVDPSFDTAAATSKQARDPMFTAGAARRILALYTDAGDPADARLAVLSGDPDRMPPVLLHAGSREMLAADARALDAWLRAAEVDVRTTVWPGQIHVFQLFYPLLPEARQAIREAGAFMKTRVAAPPAAV